MVESERSDSEKDVRDYPVTAKFLSITSIWSKDRVFSRGQKVIQHFLVSLSFSNR